MQLIFTCNSNEDFDKMKLIISKSKFNADALNYEFRSLYFQCRDRQDANALEFNLLQIVSENDISGYFELEEK
ncbi:MAG: hypothetical protein KIT33_07945 [Candidatus Kapabacteria bacterium]|nr:hypothetical protein [Candidatus Kapabacteria bacterium]MBX3043125.1 hypothetical protein [Ignavibacteriota bacterium]MCW5884886.1 hypothetical protein [Candidatus Kapabacteria bacterium]